MTVKESRLKHHDNSDNAHHSQGAVATCSQEILASLVELRYGRRKHQTTMTQTRAGPQNGIRSRRAAVRFQAVPRFFAFEYAYFSLSLPSGGPFNALLSGSGSGSGNMVLTVILAVVLTRVLTRPFGEETDIRRNPKVPLLTLRGVVRGYRSRRL